MLINHTTGEIAYHCLVFDENGDSHWKQRELKDEEGDIEYIKPIN